MGDTLLPKISSPREFVEGGIEAMCSLRPAEAPPTTALREPVPFSSEEGAKVLTLPLPASESVTSAVACLPLFIGSSGDFKNQSSGLRGTVFVLR